MSSEEPLMGTNGMPVMTQEQKDKGASTGMKMGFGFFLVPKLIAFGLAFCIWTYGNHALYQRQIDIVKENDYGFVFLGVVLFSWLVWFLNMYPALAWKSQIMGQHKNLRANMFFYQVSNSPELPLVMMVEEGDVGKYNRANRSLHHFMENSLNLVLNFVFASFAFSKPSFILMALFALGRIMHMTGYTKGYGSHAAGFMLSNLIGNGILEMLVLLTALGAFDVL
jgi:hypothetical protein